MGHCKLIVDTPWGLMLLEDATTHRLVECGKVKRHGLMWQDCWQETSCHGRVQRIAPYRHLLLLLDIGHGMRCHRQALQLLLQLQHGEIGGTCTRDRLVEQVGHRGHGGKAVVAAGTAGAGGTITPEGGWVG